MFKDPDTVWCGRVIESCPDEWKVNADFPEIPGTLVESKAWTVVCSRPFKTAEAMHMKEARAINWCLRRSSKHVHTHNSRRLVLCDNMSVVLSFERKRAHVYPLLRQVRLSCALSLASGTFYSLRWIPSELNPSDLPSRRFEKWSKSYQTGQWLADLIDESREQYARHVLFDSDSGDWIYCRDFSSAHFLVTRESANFFHSMSANPSRRILPRSQAYQGTVDRRESRLLKRQIQEREPGRPRTLLPRKTLPAAERRESKLAVSVLAALRRAGGRQGACLHEVRKLIAKGEAFMETVRNEFDESEEEAPSKRTAAEKRRLIASSKRKRQASTLAGAAALGDLSYLERESVGVDVQEQYSHFLRAFLRASPRAHPTRATDSAVDQFMVEYMNGLYLEGHDANIGDKLIAAWIYQYPEFGRRGSRLLPRVTRALKG